MKFSQKLFNGFFFFFLYCMQKAIIFQMHSYSHVCTACKGRNVALTKRRYFWALICTHSMHFFRMNGKLAKMWSHFTQKNEIHRSREDSFSRNLFSNFKLCRSSATMEAAKKKIRERNPADVPELRAAITEICGAITQEMCISACRSVYDRLLRCSANNGGYIV